MEMAEPKDVMLGILGASGALAGLLLVFAGFVLGPREPPSFPEDSTPNSVIEQYKKAGRLAVWPFWGALISTLLSLAWLLFSGVVVYWLCIGLFVSVVIGTGIYGTLSAYRYL